MLVIAPFLRLCEACRQSADVSVVLRWEATLTMFKMTHFYSCCLSSGNQAVWFQPHSGCEIQTHSGCEIQTHTGCEIQPHSGCEIQPHTGCQLLVLGSLMEVRKEYEGQPFWLQQTGRGSDTLTGMERLY